MKIKYKTIGFKVGDEVISTITGRVFIIQDLIIDEYSRKPIAKADYNWKFTSYLRKYEN